MVAIVEGKWATMRHAMAFFEDVMFDVVFKRRSALLAAYADATEATRAVNWEGDAMAAAHARAADVMASSAIVVDVDLAS